MVPSAPRNSVPEVRDLGRVDHIDALECDRLAPQVLEEP
jgi:hypothetical protein